MEKKKRSTGPMGGLGGLMMRVGSERRRNAASAATAGGLQPSASLPAREMSAARSRTSKVKGAKSASQLPRDNTGSPPHSSAHDTPSGSVANPQKYDGGTHSPYSGSVASHVYYADGDFTTGRTQTGESSLDLDLTFFGNVHISAQHDGSAAAAVAAGYDPSWLVEDEAVLFGQQEGSSAKHIATHVRPDHSVVLWDELPHIGSFPVKAEGTPVTSHVMSSEDNSCDLKQYRPASGKAAFRSTAASSQSFPNTPSRYTIPNSSVQFNNTFMTPHTSSFATDSSVISSGVALSNNGEIDTQRTNSGLADTAAGTGSLADNKRLSKLLRLERRRKLNETRERNSVGSKAHSEKSLDLSVAKSTMAALRDFTSTPSSSGLGNSRSKNLTEEDRQLMLYNRRIRNRESAVRSRDRQRKRLQPLSDDMDIHLHRMMALLDGYQRLLEELALLEWERATLIVECNPGMSAQQIVKHANLPNRRCSFGSGLMSIGGSSSRSSGRMETEETAKNASRMVSLRGRMMRRSQISRGSESPGQMSLGPDFRPLGSSSHPSMGSNFAMSIKDASGLNWNWTPPASMHSPNSHGGGAGNHLAASLVGTGGSKKFGAGKRVDIHME
ncbi:hypothetical protein FVE85_2218 [Porphyridium purpureum]|uniref:BZIP domain-containing protein n=1 Tax=Porphyridium purpureum TaxID=35688 RepID=A0A5J4YZQ9_PORPP|nr:hypothetical protein FVE85_2218 [Porphyridium purpureum]|eukprot:POR4053..scf209_3